MLDLGMTLLLFCATRKLEFLRLFSIRNFRRLFEYFRHVFRFFFFLLLLLAKTTRSDTGWSLRGAKPTDCRDTSFYEKPCTATFLLKSKNLNWCKWIWNFQATSMKLAVENDISGFRHHSHEIKRG